MSSTNGNNKRKAPEPAEVKSSSLFGQEVLGCRCLILFDTDIATRVPYSGRITGYRYEVVLSKNKKEEDQSPSPSKKGHKKKKRGRRSAEDQNKTISNEKEEKDVYQHEDLHEISFEDGEVLWMNLTELQGENRLWWQDAVPEKQERNNIPPPVLNPEKPKSPAPTPAPTPAPQPATAPQAPAMPSFPFYSPFGMPQPARMQAMQNMQMQMWQSQMQTMQAMSEANAASNAEPGDSTQQSKDDTPAGNKHVEDTTSPPAHAYLTGTQENTTTTPIPAQPTQDEPSVEERAMDKPPVEKPAPKPRRRKAGQSTGVDWVDDMRLFLEKIPHGRRMATVSSGNASAIVRQIAKLAKGEGITSKHWPDGTCFLPNHTVDYAKDDIGLLLQNAKAFEKVYGQTKSGPWLLLHPIEKLKNYAEWRKENPQGAAPVVAAENDRETE